MSTRDGFLQNVRRALAQAGATPPFDGEATDVSAAAQSVEARALAVRAAAEAGADALLSELARSAAQAGWHVARVASEQEAAVYVASLARERKARSILRSAHSILDRLDIERLLSGDGIDVGLMAIEEAADNSGRDEQRQLLRQRAANADIGVTGADFAVAETGTCVLLIRKGVSRLVSLLPPVHVAVVERGNVLPSLDQLFLLLRSESLRGSLGSYVSLITGPSRSADIEYTIVTGVHGPGEAHMVLIG